jgi:hypothetical protein
MANRIFSKIEKINSYKLVWDWPTDWLSEWRIPVKCAAYSSQKYSLETKFRLLVHVSKNE